MMYSILAKYYDDLVKDDVATKAWVTFIETHAKPNTVLELACGSGEITLALANAGYRVDASDISEAMLEEARSKDVNKLVNFFQMDMSELSVDKTYDTILCLCDSVNYLVNTSSFEKMIQRVHAHLSSDGCFVFDVHSLDRNEEFQEEFYEEGEIEAQQYSWSIVSEDMYLYHNFCFYDALANVSQEQHIQRIYTPQEIAKALDVYFTFDVYTDFTQEGICEGEKYFYVCRKKR